MLHLETVVQRSAVVSQYVYVGRFSKLERSECVHEHESCELRSAIDSAEYILVENKVGSEEENEGFGIDHHRVLL